MLAATFGKKDEQNMEKKSFLKFILFLAVIGSSLLCLVFL